MSAQPPKLATAQPVQRTAASDDWREALVASATDAAARVTVRERARNPMIPDNFLDLADSGLPADIQVLPVPIPRQGIPQEMAQYRDAVERQWLHLPWSVVSKNHGLDGKAVIPGAMPHDLGGGMTVATLAGNFLMYANRKQYQDRRKENLRRYQERVSYKTESRFEEQAEKLGARGGMRVDATNTGPMTVEELFEYEKSIGEEAPIRGARIERD